MKASSAQNSFTLVELLVALTILTFMILMMAEMSGLVSKASHEGMSRVDNFIKSRAMLDLVASDLQHAVIRSDLPIFQTGGTNNVTTGGFGGGNYSASLFTQVPGISSSSVRNVSCVTYEVVATQDSDKIFLQRSDMAVPWVGGASSIPFQGSLATPLGNAVAREMAPGVVGFQFTFRRADGTVTPTYTGYVSTNAVIAVGVTIAVVGDQALKELSVQNLTAIQTSLANAVTNAASITSVKALWDAQLTANFYSKYPKDLATNLKTFERWIVPALPF